MSAIEEVEKLLDKLTRGEKAQVLQWVARDLGDAFSGIDSAPDVCGGEPCIIRTRIPVWVLVQARKLGLNDAALLVSYPTFYTEQALPDQDVFAFAVKEGRILLTLNRKHFIRLHQEIPDHTGIIVCTFDADFPGQARRIHTALNSSLDFAGQRVRINRP